jgi:IMP dehydrogenase
MGSGSRDRYGQADVMDSNKLVPEGIEGQVPYKGSLSVNIHQLVGGLRAGMGYLGCKDVTALHSKARFMQITSAALREGHVHDVFITKEAPNYRVE